MKQLFNQVIAFILMYAVMLQFFGQLNTVIHYELNKQELTDLYCINKGMPELSCFARCYLKNQLEEHSTTNDANLPVESQLKFQPLFITSLHELMFDANLEITLAKHQFGYSQSRGILISNNPFRPPIV